jgi:hypothetical protein
MTNTTDENNLIQTITVTGTQTGFYEIKVKGQLDGSWSDWLEGLQVILLDNEEMLLKGCICDQAALLGILNKIYGLNLTLLSVSQINQKE